MAVAFALLLAGCDRLGSGERICMLAPEADVVAALGVPVASAKPARADHPQCTWDGARAEDGLPRTMSASLYRETALRRADARASGALFFEDQLHLLERDFPTTRVLGAPGQAVVIGFGDIGEERFTGGLIARKGGDVLVMRIEGADPAAFEAVARRIVDKM